MNKQNNQHSPELTYWHVYTDESGVSRQKQVTLTDFEEESMGGKSAKQFNKHLMDSAAHIIFAEMPAGWRGEWHENPKPQWIIPLSGKWFVKTMDGMKVEMGAGELSFGGDQYTKADKDGNKGHVSGTVGDEPVKLMIIQLKDEVWKAAKPEDISKI